MTDYMHLGSMTWSSKNAFPQVKSQKSLKVRSKFESQVFFILSHISIMQFWETEATMKS